ncbi:TetR/AcrR family transcriptional regulator [Campylobacterota bacterium DY0563]
MSSVRERLIEASFHEVYTLGYSAASLSNILERAQVKKGGMYHHFPSKKAMVLTMLEEKLQDRINTKWKSLIETEKNQIEQIITIIKDKSAWDLKNGCPLGNLLQESLEHDEDFSKVLDSILEKWKLIFINALKKAKQNNEIDETLNIEQCATFLIASIEGALLLVKKSNDDKNYDSCVIQLENYLNLISKK